LPDRDALDRDIHGTIGGRNGWKMDFDSFGFNSHIDVRREECEEPYRQTVFGEVLQSRETFYPAVSVARATISRGMPRKVAAAERREKHVAFGM